MIRTSVFFSLFACLFVFACSQPKTNTSTSTSTSTPIAKTKASIATSETTMTAGVLPPVLEKDAYNELTKEEAYVILEKGTERSFSGAYHTNKEEEPISVVNVIYPCLPLIQNSVLGQVGPSFDDEYTEGAVEELTDADGRRVEIVCGNCGGHLGHVFRGERMTAKSTRHCVNSASINFVPTTN